MNDRIPVLFTPAEAGEILRVHPNTLAREREKGHLDYINVGRRVFHTDAHLRDYIANQGRPKRECHPEHASLSTETTGSSAERTRRTSTSTGASPEAAASVARARTQEILKRRSVGSWSLSTSDSGRGIVPAQQYRSSKS